MEIIREMTKYLELNNEIHTICQNLWGTPEAVFMEKSVILNTLIRAQERLKKNTAKQEDEKKKEHVLQKERNNFLKSSSRIQLNRKFKRK